MKREAAERAWADEEIRESIIDQMVNEEGEGGQVDAEEEEQEEGGEEEEEEEENGEEEGEGEEEGAGGRRWEGYQ